MNKINEDFLKRAIEYASKLVPTSPEHELCIEEGSKEEREKAILALHEDFGHDSGFEWHWGAAVRAYYDACVEMSAQKEVDVADKHKGCSSCQGTGWVNGEPGNSCDIPSARISDTERPPVRSEDEP